MERLRLSKRFSRAPRPLRPPPPPPVLMPWYYAPFFIACWFILFQAVIIPLTHDLPMPLTRKDEKLYPDSFIAERAHDTLKYFTSVGSRALGSAAYQNLIYILEEEIIKIANNTDDYFKFRFENEFESFIGQSMQNSIVRLTPKDATTRKSIVLNTNVDTADGTPGAGDNTAMMANMLEVMRIISKSKGPFKVPLIFLFNAHKKDFAAGTNTFLYQEYWLNRTGAVINLDSYGNGGREVLFQSTANHTWILSYYQKVPHPFASVLGEEIFLTGLFPFNTSFKTFHEYKDVPGFDLAYTFNGYVHETQFDSAENFPMASLQNTGDNLLTLVRDLMNAEELTDEPKSAVDSLVYYDILGWFLVYYTKTVGIAINVLICLISFVVILIALYMLALDFGSFEIAFTHFLSSILSAVVSISVGCCLTLMISNLLVRGGYELSWLTETWLVFGLYFCPMFFGMLLLPAIHLTALQSDKLSLYERIQLLQHAHCILMIITTLVLISMGARSAYFVMLTVIFYTLALSVNLVTKLYAAGPFFSVTILLSQIFPFLYFASRAYITLYSIRPAQSSEINSETSGDFAIAVIAIAFSVVIAGYLIPMLMLFQNVWFTVFGFAAIAIFFLILSFTQVGFPFLAKLAAQRLVVNHIHRFHLSEDKEFILNDSDVFFEFYDTRISAVIEYLEKLGEIRKCSEFCDESEWDCLEPRYYTGHSFCLWTHLNESLKLVDGYPEIKIDDRYKNRRTGMESLTLAIYGSNTMKFLVKNSTSIQFDRTDYLEPFRALFGKRGDWWQANIDYDTKLNDTVEMLVISNHLDEQLQHSKKLDTFLEGMPNYVHITWRYITYGVYNLASSEGENAE